MIRFTQLPRRTGAPQHWLAEVVRGEGFREASEVRNVLRRTVREAGIKEFDPRKVVISLPKGTTKVQRAVLVQKLNELLDSQ